MTLQIATAPDELLVLWGRMAERELGTSLIATPARHPLTSQLDNTEMILTSSEVLSKGCVKKKKR